MTRCADDRFALRRFPSDRGGLSLRDLERDARVLRIYGGLLALVHLVAAVHWFRGPYAHWMTKAADEICWPWLAGCASWRPVELSSVHLLLGVYASASVFVAALYGRGRNPRAAWWGLLALELAKLCFLALDFRIRQNQNYMASWVTWVFLFLPCASQAIRLLLPTFYFWAGVLKLNKEWMSGSAIYGELWVFGRGPWLPWACAYVVLLELVLIWGLLSRRRVLFWATLGQLVLFHVLSYSVVSFYYPLLMFALLAIYPLSGPRSGVDLWRTGKRSSTALLLAVFCALQIFPWTFPGDPALTGEGRHFSLNMFDAKVDCQMEAFAQVGSERRTWDLRTPAFVRLRCDPVIAWNRIRSLCRDLRGTPWFDTLALRLDSKRFSDESFTRVVDEPGVCLKELSYSPFRPNAWIRGR